jgi:hypothetical protein
VLRPEILLYLGILGALAPCSAQTYIPITNSERFSLFVKRSVGPVSIGKNILQSGLKTRLHMPKEWDRGWNGFGHRFGSTLVKSSSGNAVEMAVSFVVKDDTRYFRSEKVGAGKRIKHAVHSTFTTRTQDGGNMPAYSRFSGIVAGSFIVNPMMPAGHDKWDNAVKRSVTTIGLRAMWNVLNEFYPDIRKKLRR